MKIGYVRVSTKEQHLDRQIELMKQEQVDEIRQEMISGKDIENRPIFKELLGYLRLGDTLVVASLDRLGRNYEDIRSSVTLLMDKGVNVKVLDAPFLEFNTGNETLDKAMFDMFLSLLSYIAQNEREKLLERQRQGINEAKKRGAYKGKQVEYRDDARNPGKRAIYRQVVSSYKDGVPKAQIAREVGISRTTVYSIIRMSELIC
ncbi:recombinase family protein [Enterococcus faecalis]|nr:recombinase family protein [Enterococcus faecalis]